LLEILGKTPPCAFQLPLQGGEEIDYDRVNVQVVPHGASDAESLYHVRTATGCEATEGQGWYYDTSTEPWSIGLCSASCERSRGGQVSVLLGCGPPPVPF
jgi:hypothetical protein